LKGGKGMEGWVSLHRKILSSPYWQDPFYLKLWTYCLLKASHKPHSQLVGNQIVHLTEGQFITGRNVLHEDFTRGMKPSYALSSVTIWRMILNMEMDGMLNIKKTNKYSVVTVVNWHEYQQTEQQMNNKRSTDEQQLNTNNNGNKGNNDNKKKKENIYTPEFIEFWNVYPRGIGKSESFKVWQKIIKKGEKPDYIIQCATNYAKDCEIKGTEERFIKHPKTFLNEDRYKDYAMIVIGGGSSAKSQTSHEGVRHGRHTPQSGFEQEEWESLIVGTPPQIRVQ